MDHVRMGQPPQVEAPVMVVAFSGWNDAGDAASTALARLNDHWNAEPFGDLDPEPFTHFGAVRPSVRLHDGRRTIHWPTVELRSAHLAGCDVVTVVGPEPALRWRLFCDEIVALAEALDVTMMVSLGALLADFPHTRPVQVMSSSASDELLARFDLRPPTYEGPTGIVGVLGHAATEAGIPAAALWAAVPSYAAQLPAPRASAALVQRLGGLLGADPPELYAADIAQFDARLQALLDENTELGDYVERLEELVDGIVDGIDDGFDGLDGFRGGRAGHDPSTADSTEFVADVENFLRQAGPSAGPGGGERDDGESAGSDDLRPDDPGPGPR